MKQERGNILFLILLAVVLFAALSYAVTSQREQVGSGMSKEGADAAAANIITWLGTVDMAVQRLRIIKGYPDYMIDFTDPINLNFDGTPRYENNTLCTTTDCEVFSPAGGGAIANDFSSYGVSEINLTIGVGAGSRDYVIFNWENMGTPANDVVLQIPFVKPEICKAINRREGISECPSVSASGWRNFSDDARAQLNAASPPTMSGTETKGRKLFCQCTPYVSTAGWGMRQTGTIDYVVMER